MRRRPGTNPDDLGQSSREHRNPLRAFHDAADVSVSLSLTLQCSFPQGCFDISAGAGTHAVRRIRSGEHVEVFHVSSRPHTQSTTQIVSRQLLATIKEGTFT